MNRQQIAEHILGDLDWHEAWELPEDAINRAIDLCLDVAEAPLKDIVDIYETLRMWGWVVEAGLATAPPWENVPWDQLMEIRPWEANGLDMIKAPKRRKVKIDWPPAKQIEMF